MTDVLPGTDEAAAGKRGRPRPAATIDRDQRVLSAIQTNGSTRDELLTTLNEGVDDESAKMTTSQVYLSLYRLRKDGLVDRVRDGGAHRWRQTSTSVAAV